MIARSSSSLAGATALAAGIFSASCGSGPAAPPAKASPPEVFVMQIAPENVTLSSEWVATLDGYTNAQVRPQVSGYLITRSYEEGGRVRKGDVLFEIDPRPFQMAVNAANAKVSEARAQLDKADRDVKRDTPLAEQRAIAQSQLDADLSAQLAGRAALESANAAVDAAKLNLEFTNVTSLIDGVAAIATAQIGDLVGPTSLLTTVSQLDPIKVYFPLSEPEYLQAASRLNTPGANRRPWTTNSLTLVLSDGSTYAHKGVFLTADRQVDPKTSTIRASASFPNPGNVLRPGQFARVIAETTEIKDALLVPQRAVAEMQGAYSIRVLSPENVLSTHQVSVGERVGSRWIVRDGLKAGDRIVVEGPAVKDGATVVAKPFVAPAGSR